MRIDTRQKIGELLEPSDLSPDLQHVVEVIGLELVRKLIIQIGGTGIPHYFPDPLSYDKAIYRLIVKYEELDLREISKKTGISFRRLKEIEKRYRKEKEISS